jgi:hypothetical protein
MKSKSQKQEARVAKNCCGRVQAASGALDGAKGDVRNDIFLVECKITDKDFYALTKSVWDKIRKEAIKDNLRIPVLYIEIQDKRFMIVDEFIFAQIFNESGVITPIIDLFGGGKSWRIEKNIIDSLSELPAYFPKSNEAVVQCGFMRCVIMNADKYEHILKGE